MRGLIDKFSINTMRRYHHENILILYCKICIMIEAIKIVMKNKNIERVVMNERLNNPMLQLTADFFSRLNLHTRVIRADEPLDDTMDLGLRKLLLVQNKDRVDHFHMMDPDFIQKQMIYFTVDQYECHYLFIPIPEQEAPLLFTMGPYLTETPSIYRIQELCRKLSVPPEFLTPLSQYYSTLPAISQERILEPFVESLREGLYGAGRGEIRYVRQRQEATGHDYNTASVAETSKTAMLEQLRVLLGGRVAEALVMKDICTGASNDLERATSIANSMVTRYGMSDALGPVVYGHSESAVFLGRDFGNTRDYSEQTAAAIDDEIKAILSAAYAATEAILAAHMDQLEAVAQYLLEHEKMDGAQFERMMRGETGEESPEMPAEDTPAAEE